MRSALYALLPLVPWAVLSWAGAHPKHEVTPEPSRPVDVAPVVVQAPPSLLTFEPPSDPELAPSFLVALGDPPLGTARVLARQRLVELLASEKKRHAPDAEGNVVTIIESLGDLGDPAAAPVLEKELFDPFHDLANRTMIVKALGKIGSRASVDALVRYRKTFVADANADAFTKELENELCAALDDVVDSLRG